MFNTSLKSVVCAVLCTFSARVAGCAAANMLVVNTAAADPPVLLRQVGKVCGKAARMCAQNAYLQPCAHGWLAALIRGQGLQDCFNWYACNAQCCHHW
jgi:hypothetical protein